MDQGRLESHDWQGKIQTALHLVDGVRTLLLLPKATFGFPLLLFPYSPAAFDLSLGRC